MKCHNCGKAGHISTDRKKEKSGKPQNGNFKNKGERFGSIFSASEVSDAVSNDEDEGFVVASQEVVFCATFESDVDEDYPVDAEGEDFEVMEESEQMPELIAPVSPVPVPVQPTDLQHPIRCHKRHLPKVPGGNTTWTTSISSTELSAVGWYIRAEIIRRTSW